MTEIRFFQVGGCVRDGLLGLKTKDIDFSVEAPDFESMLAAVEARCSKVFRDKEGVPIGAKHFTLRGLDPKIGPVDFALCRKDGPSTDGRHPDFVEHGTLADDLARRDFTVNAMALADDGTIIDHHGGQEDLRRGILRFVGKPEDRLQQDALRAFRGARFEVTKGMMLHTESFAAIASMTVEDFDAVSDNRVRDELHKMFATDTARAMQSLADLPILLKVATARGVWFKPTLEDR